MTREGMQVDVDRAKAEAFAGRLLAALNDGALWLTSRSHTFIRVNGRGESLD